MSLKRKEKLSFEKQQKMRPVLQKTKARGEKAFQVL